MDIKTFEIFHHAAIRKILKIPMTRVQDKSIKNNGARKIFLGIDPIRCTWRRWQILFISSTSHLRSGKHPKISLSATTEGKRYRGTPRITVKDSTVDIVINLISAIDSGEKLGVWIGHVKDKSTCNRPSKNKRKNNRNDPDENDDGIDEEYLHVCNKHWWFLLNMLL